MMLEMPKSGERRVATRVRPATPIQVTFGRGNGSVVDLSQGGMRVRHAVATMRGAQVRVSFEWQKERFVATAVVLASHVAALGTPTTLFDTRLRFEKLPTPSSELLRRVMTAIHSRQLRRWVANLRGLSSEPVVENRESDGMFLRCRLVGSTWKTTRTHDPSNPPPNGFTVPATINKRELETLCNTYLRANEDERHLIRLLAEEAVNG